MIKDTFFSPSRFMNLCRKDMVENWKTNLIRIAALYGIMVLMFVGKAFFSYRSGSPGTDPVVDFSLNTFLFVCIVGGILLASTMMDRMKRKTSRLSVMMNPVTPFESFFSRWFIYTVVYLLVVVIVYVLADYTRVLFAHLFYSDVTIVPASLKYVFSFSGDYQLFYSSSRLGQTVLQYFVFQSFFVLGATIWPKNSFIKTLLAGMFIIFSYSIVATLTMYILWGSTNISISDASIPRIDFSMLEHLNIIIGLFFILFNWVMAYYRFKESDVIN